MVKRMIQYLVEQTERMNEEQKGLVARMSKLHENEWQKVEKERLSLLYLWLHMSNGSVENRKWRKK